MRRRSAPSPAKGDLLGLPKPKATGEDLFCPGARRSIGR